jgi:tetratricopeptide (TPR) repeat protein
MLLGGAPTARADQSSQQRAMELFEQSEAAYTAGELERSAQLLEEAYALDPDPTLLYNLARVYEGLGKLSEAERRYRQYLECEPETADRGAIEKRIETLHAQIAERQRLLRAQSEEAQPADSSAPAVPSAAEARTSSSPSWLPWLLAGTGVAVIAAGAGFGLLAARAEDEAERDETVLGARAAHNRATDYATGANVAFAVGGVLTAAGLSWVAIAMLGAEPSEQSEAAWSVGLTPSSVELCARF